MQYLHILINQLIEWIKFILLKGRKIRVERKVTMNLNTKTECISSFAYEK